MNTKSREPGKAREGMRDWGMTTPGLVTALVVRGQGEGLECGEGPGVSV